MENYVDDDLEDNKVIDNGIPISPKQQRDSRDNSPDPNQQVCPLFPYFDDPNNPNERKILARNVARIQLYWHKVDPMGRKRRVVIPRDYFERRDREGALLRFQINPFETEESDINDWFGGGDYYIEAKDKNHIIIGGRNLYFPGPAREVMRNSNSRLGSRGGALGAGRTLGDDDDDDGDDIIDDDPPRRENPMKEMLQILQKSADERVNSAQRFADTTLQYVLGNRKDENVQVESLKRQYEDLQRDHREELRRRDKENEDDRTRFRADMDRRDREIDSLRKRNEDEVRELRTRYDRDTDDLKKRYERDSTHETDRLESKYRSLEKEYNEQRDRDKKRIFELEKELLELQRDLAAVPEEKDEKPVLPEGTPWWAPMAMQALQQLQKGGVPGLVAPANPNAVAQTPPPAPHPSVVAQQQAQQAQMQAQQQAILAQQQAQAQAQQQAQVQVQQEVARVHLVQPSPYQPPSPPIPAVPVQTPMPGVPAAAPVPTPNAAPNNPGLNPSTFGFIGASKTFGDPPETLGGDDEDIDEDDDDIDDEDDQEESESSDS